MNIPELWWNRLVNSVRFIDDVKDVLMDNKSVIMNFKGDIPWIDTMCYTLEQQLAFMTDERSFEVHDVSGTELSPGEYLFERFCTESERKKYWPCKHRNHERFLAENNNTTLNRRICCITGLTAGNAGAWLRSVTEYLQNRNSEERGIFILVVQNFKTVETEYLGNICYRDYVSDYDSLMLCLTLLSSEKCCSILKRYVSEIATNIAGDDVETAGLLASEGLNLSKDPLKTAERVFRENDLSTDFLTERVESAVWEAQLKMVFPRLEEIRRNIIQKYSSTIGKYLPVTSTFSERIKPHEMEIAQLYHISCHHKFFDKKDSEMIKFIRDIRNMLAHRNIIAFDDFNYITCECCN